MNDSTEKAPPLSWQEYLIKCAKEDPHGLSPESKEVDEACAIGALGYVNYGKALKAAKRYNFSLPEHRVKAQEAIGKAKAEALKRGNPWPPAMPQIEIIYPDPEVERQRKLDRAGLIRRSPCYNRPPHYPTYDGKLEGGRFLREGEGDGYLVFEYDMTGDPMSRRFEAYPK